MTALRARDVAAELRRRMPGLPIKKQHKLLYYCQGHHLAAVGEPLFSDTVTAWDMGPVVGSLWKEEADGLVLDVPERDLDEAQLNTLGYVLSRYGALTGTDLERLSHSEGPYLKADEQRPPGGRVRIEQDWMRDYFRSPEAFEEGTELPPPEQLRQLLGGATERRQSPAQLDDAERLRARLRASA